MATGPFVGEGFDCAVLDALFLAAPIAFKGRLVQYVGRILRPHSGKTTAEVHDYHDINTGVLASSLAKRAPGYTSLGFPDPRKLASRRSYQVAQRVRGRRFQAVWSLPWGANRACEQHISLPSTWRYHGVGGSIPLRIRLDTDHRSAMMQA